MKPFFASYVKELKANKILFFFIFFLFAVMNAYWLVLVEYIRYFQAMIESGDNLPLFLFLWSNFDVY